MAKINVRLEVIGRIPEQTTLHALECPFCGFDGQLGLVSPRIIADDKWSVVCPECHAKGPLVPTVSDAIQAWGKRSGAIL